MKSDKERIHRWLTQADLERMLDEAREVGFAVGVHAGLEAAIGACRVPCSGDFKMTGCAEAIRALPRPERKR